MEMGGGVDEGVGGWQHLVPCSGWQSHPGSRSASQTGAMSTRHRRKQQGISNVLTAVSQVFTWKKYSELGLHRHEGPSHSELSGKRGVFGKTFR